MKKRLTALALAPLLAFASLALAACNTDEAESSQSSSENSAFEASAAVSDNSISLDNESSGIEESSSAVSEENSNEDFVSDIGGDTEGSNANDDNSSLSDEVSDESSAPEENSEDDSDFEYSEDDVISDGYDVVDMIEVGDESGAYIFYPNGTGFYSASFDAVQTDANELCFKLHDDRSFVLKYSEIEYDAENGVGYTEMNGMSFVVTEIIDDSNLLCQALDCTEEIKGFEEAVYTISIMFYPELEYGELIIGFVYEAKGNVYSLSYADGNKGKKTIVYDEETGAYSFE